MKDVIKAFFDDEINSTISSTINEKVLSNQYTDSGARIINLWIKDELLDDDRDETQRWHKFSLIEVIWINLVEELRDTGYSKEKIKKVKDQLLLSIEGISSKYPYLEFHLIASILYGSPFFILIDKEGNANIVGRDNYVAILNSEHVTCHTVVNLDGLFKRLMDKIDRSKWTFAELFKLSKEELELLTFIKMGDFQTIKIVKRNGEIDRMEGTERIAPGKRMIDILNQGDYQNIEVKQENGKVVCIHRTVKRKI
ncbi:MAG TPA: hypothetical protein VIN73_12095 [Vicingaceae bacterium]